MPHSRQWLWATGIACGLALLIGSAAITQGVLAAGTSRRSVWPSWSKVSSKIVPIVSLGTPGLRLGLAQVAGPAERVKAVRAVLQLDGDFKSVRAKILVPSDSMTDLRRVQGTAVTGVVQYSLVDFRSHPKAAPAPAAAPQQSAPKACPKPHHDHGHHYGQRKHQPKKCGRK